MVKFGTNLSIATIVISSVAKLIEVNYQGDSVLVMWGDQVLQNGTSPTLRPDETSLETCGRMVDTATQTHHGAGIFPNKTGSCLW